MSIDLLGLVFLVHSVVTPPFGILAHALPISAYFRPHKPSSILNFLVEGFYLCTSQIVHYKLYQPATLFIRLRPKTSYSIDPS